MHQVPRLRGLSLSVRDARQFYYSIGADSYGTHGYRVLSTARRAGIVEGPIITDKNESQERREANMLLAVLCLYHTINPTELPNTQISIPIDLQNAAILRELRTFFDITRVIRNGSSPEDLIPILNGGSRAPLALLAVLADYAATHHDHGARASSFTGDRPPILRVYKNTDEAERAMVADAIIGERFLASVAELFGYADLAGRIIQHAYRTNHPELHDFVVNLYRRSSFRRLISTSHGIMCHLIKEIKEKMSENGFDIDIVSRRLKSEGKLMRKMCRRLHLDLYPGERFNSLRITDSFMDVLSKSNLYDIHDWAAIRVTITGYHGSNSSIRAAFEANSELEMYDYAHHILYEVIDRVCRTEGILGQIAYALHSKSSGYTAGHWDIPGTRRSLPLEVQANLASWDDFSRHGLAAHYYYLLDGPREQLDAIDQRYRDLVHSLRPSSSNTPSPPPKHADNKSDAIPSTKYG